MTSHTEFGSRTDGSTVSASFPSSVKDKVFIITGVSTNGLGQATADALATQEPRRLILTGRSKVKVQQVIDHLAPRFPKTTFQMLLMDLSSIESVRQAAQEIMATCELDAIDCVICNAGVMSIPYRQLSKDGIEMHFATNHIGHFLFVNLIMEKIIAAGGASSEGGARIVNLSSLAHMNSPIRFSDYNLEKSESDLPTDERPNVEAMKKLGLPHGGIYNEYIAYGQSKTANCLYSLALNTRLNARNVRSYAVHPGVVMTDLFRHSDQIFKEQMANLTKTAGVEVKTREQGCATSLVAALDPALLTPDEKGSHLYLSDCQFTETLPWARDSAAADRLWALSETLVNQKFGW